MASARGDQKRCSHLDCQGTMQFDREPLAQTAGVNTYGDRGWVCSANADHFQRGSGEPAAVRVASSPRGRWDDDGGNS